MTPTARLAAFTLALAAAFGIGAAVGAAVGPIEVDGSEIEHHEDQRPEHDHGRHGGFGS